MPYWRLYYHLIWATERRQPLLLPEIETKVYDAIRQKAAELKGQVFGIGGTTDHIHVATGIPPSIAIARFVGEVKGFSSFTTNEMNGGLVLAWQRGYGVVSFRHDNLQQVLEYIKRQKEHHASGKMWPSLETWEDDGEISSDRVREELVEYDPFAPDAQASG